MERRKAAFSDRANRKTCRNQPRTLEKTRFQYFSPDSANGSANDSANEANMTTQGHNACCALDRGALSADRELQSSATAPAVGVIIELRLTSSAFNGGQ